MVPQPETPPKAISTSFATLPRSKRYELSEKQWVRIGPLIAGKASDPGRTGVDNRLFVNAVLWVIRSGAHWHDLPVTVRSQACSGLISSG